MVSRDQENSILRQYFPSFPLQSPVNQSSPRPLSILPLNLSVTFSAATSPCKNPPHGPQKDVPSQIPRAMTGMGGKEHAFSGGGRGWGDAVMGGSRSNEIFGHKIASQPGPVPAMTSTIRANQCMPWQFRV